jgi:alanyl-tRNA synthetase
LCKENNIKLNKEEYFNKFAEHQEISRANVVKTGMSEQATSLISFDKPSRFIYNQLTLEGAKVIALFDEKLNEVQYGQGKL